MLSFINKYTKQHTLIVEAMTNPIQTPTIPYSFYIPSTYDIVSPIV